MPHFNATYNKSYILTFNELTPFQVMAWRQPGGKPLPELLMSSDNDSTGFCP